MEGGRAHKFMNQAASSGAFKITLFVHSGLVSELILQSKSTRPLSGARQVSHKTPLVNG